MKKKKIITRISVALAAIALAGATLAWVFGPTRVLHPTYWMWTNGMADCSARNMELFMQDGERDLIIRQRSEEQLIRMFPGYQNGNAYSSESYRGRFMSGFGKSACFMWLYGNENNWGYCIVLFPGEPPRLYIAKG